MSGGRPGDVPGTAAPELLDEPVAPGSCEPEGTALLELVRVFFFGGSAYPASAAPSAGALPAQMMESDSGDGLMEGLRRCSKETPGGIAYLVDPIRASESAASLLARGT